MLNNIFHKKGFREAIFTAAQMLLSQSLTEKQKRKQKQKLKSRKRGRKHCQTKKN